MKKPWDAENLRLTCFFNPASRAQWANSEIVSRMTGADPESRVERRAQSLTTEDAAWNGGRLSAAVQFDRIDIVWFGVPTDEAMDFPKVGEYSTAVTQFIDAIRRAINDEILISATRLAFGTVLLQPAESREASYETLAAYLPALKLDPRSRDFMYQINRPVQSSHSNNITINRLSKWAAMEAQFIHIAPTAQSAKTVLASRLEIDINSSPETSFSAELPPTFAHIEELLTFANVIASNGDRL